MTQKHSAKEEEEKQHPAIGNFVGWFIQETEHKKKDVAHKMQISPASLNQYLKKHSLQASFLWRLSQVLHYNLLMDLGQRLKIPFETKIEKELRAQLAEKEEQIEKMKIQLEVLREVR